MSAPLVVGVTSFGVAMTSAFLGNLYFWKMVEAGWRETKSIASGCRARKVYWFSWSTAACTQMENTLTTHGPQSSRGLSACLSPRCAWRYFVERELKS
jgi:hypothetical protein